MTIELIIAVVLGYLSGSIPFAYLIAWRKGVDLRTVGSGNIGATNCGRALGRSYGLTCFALDVLKGLVPVLGAGLWFGWCGGTLSAAAGWSWVAVAAGPVLGHVFPVWLGFRGGKGVATGFGVVLGVWPYLTLPAMAAVATWAAVAMAWRYVSLASVVAAVALPVYAAAAMAIMGWPRAGMAPMLAVAIVMAVLIVVRHRANLRRLAAGTESKLGERTREGG